nr:MAG TPA: hypothetical protein [Caudoviricetes sp.]
MTREPAETFSIGVGLVGWWGCIISVFLSGCLDCVHDGSREILEGICGAVGDVGWLFSARMNGDPPVLNDDLCAGGKLGVGDDVPGGDPGDGGCVHGCVPCASCRSESVEGVRVEVAHNDEPVAEVVIEVACGRAGVGEAPLVDVLESALVVEGEGPAGEGGARVVGGGG